MKKIINRIDDFLTKLEENLIFVFLFLMLAIVFWGIVNRFVLKHSLPWSEELSRYLMIWGTFIGASLGVKKATHISIDALTIYLPEKWSKIITLVSYILSLIFTILLLKIGFPFLLKLIATNQLSPAMRMPIYIAYAAVPVGMLFMSIRYLILIYHELLSIRNFETEKDDATGREAYFVE